MPYIDKIKNSIKEEISLKISSVTDKQYYSQIIANIIPVFREFIKLSTLFMSDSNMATYSSPIIYFVETSTNGTRTSHALLDSKQINVCPTLSFAYFALREGLQNISHNSEREYEYKITLGDHCTRHYSKSDLILCFDYPDPFSPHYLFKTSSSYYKCPEMLNINSVVIDIFDKYISYYIKHVKDFVSNSLPCYDKTLFHLSCKMFAMYDYATLADHDFMSEESFVFAYEVCMNIGILANSCFE